MQNAIVTGGAIVSMLEDKKPNDYDVYFRDRDALHKVASYYIDKFTEFAEQNNVYEVKPILQQCVWDEVNQKWIIVSNSNESTDIRLRVFIKSSGVAGVNIDASGVSKEASEFKKACDKIGYRVKNGNIEVKEGSYTPVYMTANAISLSDDIQLILRFYGEPDQIHSSYDFVHCMCYYTAWNNEIVTPARSLEAIINKELYYVGSKYPLCSLIRMRKFINRGWTINAGQIAKIALQISELDLTNLHIFEEQLIGVDSAYFNAVIKAVQNEQDYQGGNIDANYLIKLINEVFD